MEKIMDFQLSVLPTTSTDKYSCLQAHGRTIVEKKMHVPMGLEVHLKNYYPRDYNLNTTEYINTMQSTIDYDIAIFHTSIGCTSAIFYYTGITLPTGIRYLIKFFWQESVYGGSIKVFKGNEDFSAGIPMEQIYSTTEHSDYNAAYAEYQSLCDKVLTY